MTSYVVGYGSGEHLEPSGGFENPEVTTQGHGHGHSRRGLALLIISTFSVFYSLYVVFAVLGVSDGFMCHSRQFYLYLILGLFWCLTILTLVFRFLGPYIEIGLGWRGRCNFIFILIFWLKVAICYSIVIVSVIAVGVKEQKANKSTCPNFVFFIFPTFLMVYGCVIGFLSRQPIAHAHFIN